MSRVVVKSEITGNMWKIEAAIGDVVEEEQQVAIIESMKMEIPVIAPVAGTVVEILVKEGDPIAEEQPVLVIET
jgi:acetyl-CoA carboxylase biotin carboxyl carrier protein